MTETTTKEIRAAFGSCMRGAGIERKGSAWYVRSEEVIAVIELQASNFGPSYYCNVGLWLTSVDGGREKNPRASRAHIRTRADEILEPGQAHIAGLLDASSSLSGEQRRAGICSFVSEQLLPFCAQASKIDVLREMLATGPLKNELVWAEAARKVLRRP